MVPTSDSVAGTPVTVAEVGTPRGSVGYTPGGVAIPVGTGGNTRGRVGSVVGCLPEYGAPVSAIGWVNVCDSGADGNMRSYGGVGNCS